MALKLHCIFNQGAVLPDIVRLVEKTAHSLNIKKRSAAVEDVYNELRDNGFEIDAESVAFAYSNVPGIVGKKNFSSRADINRFGGAGMKAAIEIANKGDIKKQKLGKLGVDLSVARGIANTFSTLNGRNDVDKSRLYQLQEAMRKKAASLLDKSMYQSAASMSFEDVLKAAFDVENIQATSNEAMKGKVKGAISSIDEIWESMKRDIDQIANGIKDRAAKDRFLQMTDAIRNSSYELLLSTRQADDVIKGVLTELGYTKEINRKGNKVSVIDWNTVLENTDNWENAFTTIFRSKGFTMNQTQRIIDRLRNNYERITERQAEITLSKINVDRGLKSKVNKNAVNRLVKYKNAGILLPKNRDILNEAVGINLPDDVADDVRKITDDFEKNIKENGGISNIFTEEVIRSIRNMLYKYGASSAEKISDSLNDYIGLVASTTIGTAFNSVQNVTSGFASSFNAVVSAVVKTRNPKLIGMFMKSWVYGLADAVSGGVTLRDANTVNSLEQLQGRGGLSDRWTYQTAKGFFGYVKATLNILGQVLATATDTANGTIIYNAVMVQNFKIVLMSKGKTSSEANAIIDDTLFGKDAATGKTNRKIWNERAQQMISNQTGVSSNASKAKRIADELIWNDLITKYGMSIDEVKAVMSSAIDQRARDLGQQSDTYISPGWLIGLSTSKMNEMALKAKEEGASGKYATINILNSFFKAANMFVGGAGNWTILALQNSPVGLVQYGYDYLYSEAAAIKGRSVPLYRQQLSTDPILLEDQLKARAAMYSRLGRAVTGTFVQTILGYGVIQLIKSLSDDDDDDDGKKEVMESLEPYLRDPMVRRAIEKTLPAMISYELMYAYNKDTGQVDVDKISKFYFNTGKYKDFIFVANEMFMTKSGINRLNDNLSYANRIKNEDKRDKAKGEAIGRFAGELVRLPYVSWYDIVTKEYKIIEVGFEPDPTAQRRQKQEYKNELKSIDGMADAFMYGSHIQVIVDYFRSLKD